MRQRRAPKGMRRAARHKAALTGAHGQVEAIGIEHRVAACSPSSMVGPPVNDASANTVASVNTAETVCFRKRRSQSRFRHIGHRGHGVAIALRFR